MSEVWMAYRSHFIHCPTAKPEDNYMLSWLDVAAAAAAWMTLMVAVHNHINGHMTMNIAFKGDVIRVHKMIYISLQ